MRPFTVLLIGLISCLGISQPNLPSDISEHPEFRFSPLDDHELFKLAERITPNIACHLPRNTNLQGISLVTNAEAGGAKGKDKAQVMEVEEEWLGRS